MYITVKDIVLKYPKDILFNLLNDELLSAVNWSDPDDLIAKRLESIIIDAENEVNGYLFNYPLPLSFVPPLLSTITMDIVIYNCYRRRITNELPEYIYKNYLHKISLLKSIAEGKITLGTHTSNPIGSVMISFTKNKFLN